MLDQVENIGVYDIIAFEITVRGKVERISVLFEEHQTYRKYNLTISSNNIGKKLGIRFNERKCPNDVPTYAGGYEYWHPLFDYEFCEYDSIDMTKKVKWQHT